MRSNLSRLALVCVALLACKEPDPATQVMVVIDAEPGVRERITDVELSIKSGEGDVSAWSSRFEANITPGGGPVPWPLEIALVPGNGEVQRSYVVVARARGESGGVLAEVRAISGYVAGRSLSLPLVFDAACLERTSLCDPSFTCRAGGCVDPFIPPSELLPFEPGVRPGERESGAGGSAGTRGGSSGAGGAGGPASDASVEPGLDASTGCIGTAEVCMPGARVECGEECEGCPEGFVRLPGGACAPLLVGMTLSRGEPAPALNAVDTHYRIELPLLAETLTFALAVAEGVEVEARGNRVSAASEGVGFTVRNVPLGESTVQLTLRPTGSHNGHESRTYELTFGRSGQQRSYLKASNTGAGDTFGHAVATEGDTIVVGAPLEDSSTADLAARDNQRQNSGAAYVFQREAASYREIAYLKASPIEERGEFGTAVAIDHDTIAIGAPGEGAGGSVYLYRRTMGGGWTLEQRVAPARAHQGRRFGAALALRGDVLAVGAPADDTFALDGGAVYVFRRSGGSWGEGTVVGSENVAPAVWIGSGVALDDTRMFAGATGESSDVYPRGAVYAYALSGGAYVETQKIYEQEVGPLDFFGDSVAIDGDTLVVGAFGASGSAAGNGLLYVYRQGTEGFALEQVIGASNPSEDAHLGVRVVLRGDLIITGAPDEDSGARGVNGDISVAGRTDSGAGYVFVRDGTRWSQLALIKSMEPGAGDRYGFSVAANDDTIVFGAPGESSGATGVDGDTLDATAQGSGAVYVIR